MAKGMSKTQMRLGERCYLCGEDGSLTVDHIVPQCLYPGPLGPPVQAPAHSACNGTTTKQEEAFRNLLAASAAVPADSPLFGKMLRSLENPKAKGMRADFASRMRQLPDGSGYIGIPDGHSTWVLAKIIKGLLFLEHDGAILRPAAVRWTARRLPKDKLPHMPPFHRYREIPTVVEAFWSRGSDLPVHAFLRFYQNDDAIFSITAVHASDHFTIKDWDALMLKWPQAPRPKKNP